MRGAALAAGALALALASGCAPPPALIFAGPDDYLGRLAGLEAGQTLELAPGVYRDCLHLRGLRGRPDAPVVVRGPPRGPRPLFLGAGCAQVGLRRSAIVLVEDARWVTLSRLELDGQGAEVSGVRAGFGTTPVVGLRLEQLYLHDFDASPQFSAISSFATAWDWQIVDNRIERVGLGMYLGDSDGEAPFIRGALVGTVVLDPLGYGVQIKHQRPRRLVPGMPPDGSVTEIRGNFIRKASGGRRGEQGRPNLLLGAQPAQGPGRGDRYVVRGNLLLHNDADDEPLLQGEGNLQIVDNLLINDFAGGGLVLRPHHGAPREVDVTQNTIFSRGIGISITGGAKDAAQRVEGNVVYGLGPTVLLVEAAGGGVLGAWPQVPRWGPPHWDGRAPWRWRGARVRWGTGVAEGNL